MKRLILCLLAFFSCQAFAQLPPDKSLRILQYNASLSGFQARDIPPPSAGTPGIVYLNPLTFQPEYLWLGANLSITAGVLDAAGAGAPSCATITDATATGCSLVTAANAASARSAIGAGTSSFSGAFSALSGIPTTLAGYGITDAYPLTGNPTGFITSAALSPYLTSATAASTYATQASVTSGLAGKFNTPTGTTAQYLRGDGSTATFPAAVAFNYGAPGSRTLALSTSYQATNNAKAADVSISPSCASTLSLSGGQTCTLEARMSSSTATCSTGTVVATWTNGNTGTLTIGLNTVQTIGAPHTLKLPIGWNFILCPLSGSPTIATAVDQTAG
jgi:hypothetical protein